MVEDKVREFEIESKISESKELLEEFMNDESLQNTLSTLEILDVISYRLNAMEEIYQSIDLLITPLDVLKNFGDHIQRALQNLINFNSQKNSTAHLISANNSLDGALKLLPNLYIPTNLDDLKRLRKSVESARRSISQLKYQASVDIKELNEEFTRNIENVEALSVSLKVEEEKMKKISDTFQRDSQEMYTSNQTEFKERIESFNSRFEELLEEQTENHEEKMDVLEAELSEKIDEFDNEFQRLKDVILVDEKQAYLKSLETIKDEFNHYIEKTIKDFNEKQNQLNSLFGFVTDSSISGEFYKAAEAETKHWRTWSIITIISFIVLITFSVLAFFSEEIFNVGGVTTWIDLAKRFVLTLGIAGFATYAAKQAADHKNEARQNRMIQMKIQSINPYLSEFDSQSDEVKEIKTKLADNIFISDDKTGLEDTNKENLKAN